jgi:phosphate transport system substrate-binding protein
LRLYAAITIILAMMLGMSATSITWGQETAQMAIRVNGAAISSDQVQLWANSFMESNPGTRIVVTGSSAGKGFASFLSKNSEIVIASRVISEDEQKRAAAENIELGERLVGYSGIAVITTPKNPVSELTMAQLRKIFSGVCVNWKEVGGPDAPIRCFTRRVPESGAALFFQEKVLDKQPYGPNTTIAESWSTIIKVCSSATDLPIGIASVIPALAASDKIKIVGIKEDPQSTAVNPSDETLKTKTYPIILPFRFYWDAKTATPQLKKFVEFCTATGLPSGR